MNSAETTGTVSTASVWKSPVSSLRCKVQKLDVDFGPSPPLSLCKSPMLGATRANLSVACKAFVMEPISLWCAVGVDWVCLDQQVANFFFSYLFLCQRLRERDEKEERERERDIKKRIK